jgi:hypothetical protein
MNKGLRTYKTFKTEFTVENYAHSFKFSKCKYFSKLRKIETVHRPKIPADL